MQTPQNTPENSRTPYLVVFTPAFAFLWISFPAAVGAAVVTLIVFLILNK